MDEIVKLSMPKPLFVPISSFHVKEMVKVASGAKLKFDKATLLEMMVAIPFIPPAATTGWPKLETSPNEEETVIPELLEYLHCSKSNEIKYAKECKQCSSYQ